jgi:shikimate O-hydroxycinnamoyltransferase
VRVRETNDEKNISFVFMCNVRSRMNPPLSPQYFGNAALYARVVKNAGEVKRAPLSEVSRWIRDATNAMNAERIQSAINWLGNQGDFQRIISNFDTNFLSDDYCTTSWANMPLYGADFGWGRPRRVMTPIASVLDGFSAIFPSPLDDRSLIVWLGMPFNQMETFQNFLDELRQKSAF